MTDEGVRLPVAAAEKRDAGRGVARLPEAARQELGVLSGDTVVVEGDSPTVAKVWPGTGEAVRIDADTRANAGVNVGETVTVRAVDVDPAEAILLSLPTDVDEETAAALGRDLRDRPVQAGDRIRFERVDAYGTVEATDPEGTVRVAMETDVKVVGGEGDADEGESDAGTRTAPLARGGVAYEDIGGLDQELDLVREMIELPLSQPDLFRDLGVDPPKGVLLYGPPGTGKTLIAKAVANEVDAAFFTVSGPEIVSKYKGESEERLREVFDRAEADAPAIVFFDEIDAIAGERGDEADMESRVVAQLLTLLDGLEERGQVVVIGATNRVDAVDPALRRGGRFDREIEIGAPDEGGRREILDVHTRGMPLSDDVDLDRVAGRTHGFVGADLETLVTEAAMSALRDRKRRDDLAVTRPDVEAALAAVEPSAMREYVAEAPSASFEDVGGLEEAKRTLREAVEWPLQYGPLFEAANTDPPSGVLLYGPPGTGKTLLARALAGESDVNFIHVAGPELLDKYVGESEKAVREVFDRARQAAPTIVFFDEIDAVAGQRGDTSEASERVVSQLLTELDGLAANPNIVVVAATNRKDALDPALLRPGRLEEHVEVPLPDEAAREAILRVHTRGTPLADDVDLAAIAAETEDESGADLESLVRAASMRAVREVADHIDPEEAHEHADEVEVRREHFDL